MRRIAIFGLLLLSGVSLAQDPWKISTEKIEPSTYYGITVANGMIGIISSAEAFKVKDVVLAGAYDLYGRGRVSNFLRSFNLLNMYMEIDGRRLSNSDVSNMQQTLDMKRANFTTTFDYKDLITVSYTYYSLRQLPYSVLMDITVTAKKDCSLGSASIMEAPDALKDVQNYYNE